MKPASGGRFQSGEWRWADGGSCDCGASRCGDGVFHRVDASGYRGGGGGRAYGEAGDAGAWGKSANICSRCGFRDGGGAGVQECFRNTGQSCNAPTRMLVPRSKMEEAAKAAKMAAEATKVGDPFVEGTGMGPLVSQSQFDKVQRLIHQGIEEGARLVTGGLGNPKASARGTS